MLNTFNFDSQNEAECVLHFNFLAFFSLKDLQTMDSGNINRLEQEMTTLCIYQFISLLFFDVIQRHYVRDHTLHVFANQSLSYIVAN